MKKVTFYIFISCLLLTCFEACKNNTVSNNNLITCQPKSEERIIIKDSIIYDLITLVASSKQRFEMNIDKDIFFIGKGHFKTIQLERGDSVEITKTGFFTKEDMDYIYQQNISRQNFILSYSKLLQINYCYNKKINASLLNIKNDLPVYHRAFGNPPGLYSIDQPLFAKNYTYAIVFMSSHDCYESGDKIIIFKKCFKGWDILKTIKYYKEVVPIM